MKLHAKQLYSNLIDSLRYALSDWKSILLIAIVLMIASLIEEELEITQDLGMTLILIILFFIFLFLEEGYGARIVHETLNGSTSPPRLNNLKELMKEGFGDIIVSLTYIIAFILFFGFSLGILWSGNDQLLILLAIFIPLSVLSYVFMYGGIINLAKHHTLKSGFNLIEIVRIFRNIGLINTIILTICGFISQYLIVSCIADFGALDLMKILDIIVTFILAPLSVTFTKRLFALYGREEVNRN